MTQEFRNGYLVTPIKEGEAPFLMSKVTTKSLTLPSQADISTIKATITNVTLGTTVLDQSTLTKTDVWFDAVQTLVTVDENNESITYTYNFGWQTTATWFQATTTDAGCQFRVEVWVTPVSGQPFEAGWWLVTATKSIVPIPA